MLGYSTGTAYIFAGESAVILGGKSHLCHPRPMVGYETDWGRDTDPVVDQRWASSLLQIHPILKSFNHSP